MKEIGEVHDFRPPAVARFVFCAMRAGWMWAGIALMTLGFFSLLAKLSIENVSFVVPVTALSYAAGTTGAKLFLHERISPQRWLGGLIVFVGLTLVWLSRRSSALPKTPALRVLRFLPVLPIHFLPRPDLLPLPHPPDLLLL